MLSTWTNFKRRNFCSFQWGLNQWPSAWEAAARPNVPLGIQAPLKGARMSTFQVHLGTQNYFNNIIASRIIMIGFSLESCVVLEKWLSFYCWLTFESWHQEMGLLGFHFHRWDSCKELKFIDQKETLFLPKRMLYSILHGVMVCPITLKAVSHSTMRRIVIHHTSG